MPATKGIGIAGKNANIAMRKKLLILVIHESCLIQVNKSSIF
ncbi:hypothetical protein ACIQZG_20415 [Lysinibacillus sp. NPDC096418]